MSVDPETAANAQAYAELMVPEARLQQGIQEVFGDDPFDQKGTGAFIKWIVQDVQKEGALELEASGLTWKQVGGTVAKKAREWFLAKCAGGLGVSRLEQADLEKLVKDGATAARLRHDLHEVPGRPLASKRLGQRSARPRPEPLDAQTLGGTAWGDGSFPKSERVRMVPSEGYGWDIEFDGRTVQLNGAQQEAAVLAYLLIQGLSDYDAAEGARI